MVKTASPSMRDRSNPLSAASPLHIAKPRADWPTNLLTVHSGVVGAYSDPTVIRHSGDPLDRMYVDELSEFVRAIRHGRPPAITAEDGVRVLEILDAVVESGRSGTPIAIGASAAVAGR